MIDWNAIEPALVDVLTSIATAQPETPAPAWRAEWADRPRDLIHPDVGFALVLRVTSVTPIHEDEDRYDEDGTETQCGQRRIILNVQVESSENLSTESALNTLERIRTRIRRRSSLAKLAAVDVALIEVGATQNVSARYDGRIWSIGSLDITLCAAVNDTDPVPAGFIQRVVVTTDVQGTLTQLDHVELPPP